KPAQGIAPQAQDRRSHSSSSPRTTHHRHRPNSAALEHSAGAQLLTLLIGQLAVALTKIGALLVQQDASLLRLVAGSQRQQEARGGDGNQLPPGHEITYLRLCHGGGAARRPRQLPIRLARS